MTRIYNRFVVVAMKEFFADHYNEHLKKAKHSFPSTDEHDLELFVFNQFLSFQQKEIIEYASMLKEDAEEQKQRDKALVKSYSHY